MRAESHFWSDKVADRCCHSFGRSKTEKVTYYWTLLDVVCEFRNAHNLYLCDSTYLRNENVRFENERLAITVEQTFLYPDQLIVILEIRLILACIGVQIECKAIRIEIHQILASSRRFRAGRLGLQTLLEHFDERSERQNGDEEQNESIAYQFGLPFESGKMQVEIGIVLLGPFEWLVLRNVQSRPFVGLRGQIDEKGF